MSESDRRPADVFAFEVLTTPVGKSRPRFTNGGRTYTLTATKEAENNVRLAWDAADRPYLGEGPIRLVVGVHVTRPKSHFTSKGALSATGRRAFMPTSRPDLDNVVKLIADALNGLAWKDDAQLAVVTITRMWRDYPGIDVYAEAIQPIEIRGIEDA